jgi:nitrogen regulatory protein P-II 1
MIMACIILNDEDYVDDLLAVLMELEITGATILDGVGMERMLANDVPIFAGLIQSMAGARPYNKNIFALLNNRETLTKLIEVLKEVGIDFQQPGVGTIFALPVCFSLNQYGLFEDWD